MSKVIYNEKGTKFEFFQKDNLYAPRDNDYFSINDFNFSWMSIDDKLLHSGLTYEWVKRNIKNRKNGEC